MKNRLIALGVCLVALVAIFLINRSYINNNEAVITSPNQNFTMALDIKSSAFENNGSIPEKYSCDGENINPPLTFESVNPDAKSLTLIMDDPDAASVVGYTFDHWVKFNLDPKVLKIEEGKDPGGVTGKNSRGNSAYTGPCPPNGLHHYYFKLYSLDTELTLTSDATKADVEAAMQGHILQQAEMIGTYNRTATTT